MKTESHSIDDVLAKNATSFFIPPFQRSYAWGRNEIERYFNDVLRIINSELDEKQQDKLEHFFGTIVIKEEKAGFANKSIIIDGQQRLTTTLLFLIAIRDLEDNSAHKDYITNNYLKNNTSTYQDKIKLKQVTKDWKAYAALVNEEPAPSGVIYNAYKQLKNLISKAKSFNPKICFNHYLKAIQRMNVAVIFLDERPYKGEDPQIIFETLNSLGKPLSLSDLVRNYVLLNLDSNNQTNVYENIWYPKIETLLHDSTSDFFRDYLQLKIAKSIKAVSDNNTKEIYQIFKEFVETKFKHHQEFIDDIIRYSIWYNLIITEVNNGTISPNDNKNKEIIELLRNIFHDIKSEAFKPLVLGLFEYYKQGVNGIKLDDDSFIYILKTIRTYLIRRRILGLTQGENKNIVLFCKEIEKIVKNEISILDLFTSQSYRLRFPNDDEMRQRLETMNFYEGLKSYSKFILGKIEENNTKVAPNFRNSKITIEHIMPQKLNDTWEKELGDNFDEIHKKYLHNIGNLILTEFNAEIGNEPFFVKKGELAKSSLHYRLFIINQDKWDEESIKKHRDYMINSILETFPLPTPYKNNNNWNDNLKEIKQFSPLDPDAGDFAEGNKPNHIKIENTKFIVFIWQDVFIKFLKYIKNSNNFDFDIVLNNQKELFGKEDVIVNWSSLKLKFEENNDLRGRYKTFNGEFYNKVKDLSDDIVFIHINISASNCISRIANIMNKFNMDENSVEIELN